MRLLPPLLFLPPLLLLFSRPAPAADGPPSQVRTTVNKAADRWIGQKIPLVVELLTPGFFVSAPVFDLPRVPGLLILPPVEGPAVGSEEIGGVSFTVQRHELMVFPRRPGTIAVPPFEVRFSIKRNPLDHDSVDQTVKTSAVSLNVKSPPGSQGEKDLITSVDLKVTETWKPEPGAQVKAGDAFVRTIDWSASDVPGMAFPPFDAGHIEGLGIYSSDPVVNDSGGRGELHGGRTDKVTYVCRTGGHFVIPALTLRWWNPEEKQMKQAVFPARTFDATAPPPPPVPLSVRAARVLRDHWPAISAFLVGLALCVLAIRHAWTRVTAFLKRLLPRHLEPLNPP